MHLTLSWTLLKPSNADYGDVVNTSNSINNQRAVIDLEELGNTSFQTVDGQQHLAFLVPLGLIELNGLQTRATLSDNSGTTIGAQLEGIGQEGLGGSSPLPLTQIGYDHRNVAGRITTYTTAIPEPQVIMLLLFGNTAILLRRRKTLG